MLPTGARGVSGGEQEGEREQPLQEEEGADSELKEE
jgi:hypothetical protein